MSKERYDQIIKEAYENYLEKMVYHPEENWLDDNLYDKSYYTKDIFPTDENGWNSMFDDNNIPTKLITVTRKNEKIEVYE